jgi:hypothetical protein
MSAISSLPSSLSMGTLPSTSRLASSFQAKSPAQEFLEYANMPPAQRIFASMLGKLGITQDQFNSMTPAEQQKIEDKIREMIKKQLDDATNKPTGLITDKSA